jgi:hypothetical protein
MNRNLLKLAPMALVFVLAAGCASTNSQPQIDEVKAMAAAAQKTADEAKQAAAEAQNTANQALQAANEANSKVDHAFKKSMHK